MSAILPSVKIDSDAMLTEYFMPHQIAWILGEDELRAQKKQTFALAEKSVRVGWTHADAFKNVHKRLQFKNRDYLFATKDYPSALEYMRVCQEFAEIFNLTKSIISHGEEYLKVPRLDETGKSSGFTDEIKMGVIKFVNGSRIIAFSAHPQAMAVYGGDVGIDEFAKHPNAQLLWQTAQGRVTWGFDLAIWSSHEGDDTLFNQFAQQARAGKSPWNLYYRVTIIDAIELGLLDFINRIRGTNLTKDQFLADCRARAGLEEIFEQTYMCNPVPGGAAIVEWSAIERCRMDCPIERLHFEASDIIQHFGEFNPADQHNRRLEIQRFLRNKFPRLFGRTSSASPHSSPPSLRLGFDVAASGQGNLAAFYLDEPKGEELWLRALLTARTDDWDFLEAVLFCLMQDLPRIKGAGDGTGLGNQICWKAEQHFGGRFLAVNFASKKHELGFSLMNQLSIAQKRFPKSEQDIAADYFALRKTFNGSKWSSPKAETPSIPPVIVTSPGPVPSRATLTLNSNHPSGPPSCSIMERSCPPTATTPPSVHSLIKPRNALSGSLLPQRPPNRNQTNTPGVQITVPGNNNTTGPTFPASRITHHASRFTFHVSRTTPPTHHPLKAPP